MANHNCEDKYITLLDLARQSQIITGETACFDGKIQAGIPFSGYPSGVDVSTIGLLNGTGQPIISENAIISGNTGSTLYDVSNILSPNYDPLFASYSGSVWSNPNFSAHTSGLTTISLFGPTSAQTTDYVWTYSETGMTGDHIITTFYSGYNITYEYFQVECCPDPPCSGGTLSGLTNATQLSYSAASLDYTGPLDYLRSREDGTIDNRLTTKKLRVTGGASASTIGYVLTQVDEIGSAEWVFNSASASTNTFVVSGALDGSADLNLTYNTGGSVPPIDLSALSGDSWDLQNVLDEGTTPTVAPFSSTDSVGILPADESIVLGTGDPLGGPPTTASTLVWLDGVDATINIAAYNLSNNNDEGATKISGQNNFGESNIDVSGGEIDINTTGSTIVLEADGNILIDGLGELTSPTIGDVLAAKDASGRLKWISLSADTNTFLTGGTLNGDILTLTRNDLVSIIVTGFSSTFTGNTSGDCIEDLWVSNIHSCSPLNINPLDEGDVYFGSTSGVTIDVLNSRIGIGTDTPEEKLHVKDGDFLIENGSKFITDLSNPYPTVRFSGSSSILSQIGLTNPDSAGINIGYRGFSEVGTPAYGKQGDAFIYSSAASNGLNLISQVGSGSEEDYIRFYAGQDASSSPCDMIIIGTGATRGFVGVGTETPTEKLHVADGNILMAWDQDDNTQLRIDNYNNGTHARSGIAFVGTGEGGNDSSGILALLGTGYTGNPGNWQGPYLPNSLNITTGGGNQTTNAHINIGSRRTDGEIRFFSGDIGFDNDTLLGIWNPSGLTLSGDVNTFHFNTDTIQVRNGATSGYVLTSDSNGVGTWQVSSGGSGTFTGNTSGDCINELWVSNISGCTGQDLHIGVQSGQDIYIDSTGTTDNPNLYINSKGQMGIGTNTPFSWRPENGFGIEIHNEGLSNQIPLAFTEGGARRFWFETDFAAPGSIDPVNIYGGSSPSPPLMTFYTRTTPRIGMGTTAPQGNLHISRPGNYTDQGKYPDETNIVINNTSAGYTGTSGTINKSAFRFDHLGTEKPGGLISSNRVPAWDSGEYSTTLELWNASGETLYKRIEIEPQWNTNIYGDIKVVGITTAGTENASAFLTNLDFEDGPIVRLTGDTSGLVEILTLSDNQGISIGSRGITEPTFVNYGKQGDGFLYSSAEQNGLNIISSNGAATEDYIRFYAGQTAASGNIPDMIIIGTGATIGNVGIHTDSPTTKFHIDGDIRIDDGTAQDGYILKSIDSGGTATWEAAGHTSGGCLSDLWVTNIHSCSPLNINPNNEGNIFIGSGFTFDLTGNTDQRLGINTSSPQANIHIKGLTPPHIDNLFLIEDSGGNIVMGANDEGALAIGVDPHDLAMSGESSLFIKGDSSTTTGSLDDTNIALRVVNSSNNNILLVKNGNGVNSDGTVTINGTWGGGPLGGTASLSVYGAQAGSASTLNAISVSDSDTNTLLNLDNGGILNVAPQHEWSRLDIGMGYFGQRAKLHVALSDQPSQWNTYFGGTSKMVVVDGLSDVAPFTGQSSNIFVIDNFGNVDIKKRTTTQNFTMTSGATNGYVLTSDGSGNASWQPSSGSSGTTLWSETGTTNEVLVDKKGESSYTVTGYSPGSIIAAGTGHTLNTSQYSAIMGGIGNTIVNSSSLLGCDTHLGGVGNIISGNSALHYSNSSIGGSSNVTMASSSSVMLGTTDSQMFEGVNSFIIGGDNHKNGVDGFGLYNNQKSGIIGGTNHTFASGVNNSVIIGGDGISATTNDTVYVPNLNIDTVGAGGSMFNLGLDNDGFVVTGETPVVKYATTLGELTTAFDSFKAQNVGGIVKMGATISLGADLELDFDQGIELWGGGFGFTMNGNVITVKGNRATFRNLSFTGGVNFGPSGANTNSQNVIIVDDTSLATLKFIECRMNDIVGGNNPSSSGDSTYPVIIENCGNWSVFEFIYFAVGTQSSITTKAYGPFLVKWNESGASGTRLMFKDWSCNSPERADTMASRFASVKAAMIVKVDGSVGTLYQNQVIYDQSVTIDESSTWPDIDKYSTPWGPIVKQLPVDPTVTNTFGYPGDIQITGNSAYMKVGSVTSNIAGDGDTDWIELGVGGGGTFTGNTSGDCISELWVTTISGCSPVTIGSSIQSGVSLGVPTVASGINSIAYGVGVQATGDYSQAFGTSTIASGGASHAEGEETQATGTTAHAEGNQSKAYGDVSHAEGNQTTASGLYSHAEGSQTLASGQASHAEGYSSEASGLRSHAEGYLTEANGTNSHAEGEGTIASGNSSHAESKYTIAGGTGSHSGGWGSSSKPILSLGEGSFAHFSTNEAVTASVSTGAYQDYSAILGGRDNTITELGNDSVIIGGQWNNIDSPSSDYNAIIGGLVNSITGSTGEPASYCSIVGGTNNIVGGSGGGGAEYVGIFNSFTSEIKGRNIKYTTIVGGSDHSIGIGSSGAVGSFIGGGAGNDIGGGDNSAIIGGSNNDIGDFDRSVIIGGQNITATSADTVFMPNVDLCQFGGALHSNTIIPCSPLTISPGNEGNVHIGEQGGAPVITLDILTPDEPGILIGEDSFIRWKESEQKLIIGEEEVGGKVVIEVEGDEILDVEKEKTIVKEGDFETEDGDIIVKSGSGKTVIIEAIPEVAGDDLGTNAEGKLIDLPSDSRVKENIYSLDTVVNVLEFIKNIKGYQFTWAPESRIGDPTKKHYGFLVDQLRDDLIDPKGPNFNADHQNCNEIAKSMVRTNRTKFKFGGNSQSQTVESFSYSELTPFIIEAVKAVDVKVDNLPVVGSDIFVESGNYNSTNKEIVLTLNNGNDINIPATDLLDNTNNYVIGGEYSDGLLTLDIKDQKDKIQIEVSGIQGEVGPQGEDGKDCDCTKKLNIKSIISDTYSPITADDDLIIVETSTPLNLVLPVNDDTFEGKSLIIKHMSNNKNMSISTQGQSTIDNSYTSISLNVVGDTVTLVCEGSNWWITGNLMNSLRYDSKVGPPIDKDDD